MSFQPVLPVGGYAGWRFLQRTADSQRELLSAAPAAQRETAAFRARIGTVTSAEQLVADRALLRVALGAFGLGDDLNNRAFVRKVLESATADSSALANRLADKRYLDLARAFGFGDPGGPLTRRAGFAERIVGAYETRNFESAVGEKDQSMRLALTAARELEGLSSRRTTPDGLWFSVMGNPPLRQVFETALGLPASFGALDIDRQLTVLRTKSERALGSGEIAGFSEPARREDLIRLFLMRSGQQSAPATSGASAALTLLQATGSGRIRLA